LGDGQQNKLVYCSFQLI